MELNKEVDFSYNEVKEQIKDKILSKEYKIDGRIPSERNLCDIFQVSLAAVGKAIEGLVAENFLIKRPGKGTFVRQVEGFNQNNELNKHKDSGINFNDEEMYSGNKTGIIIFLRCIHHNFTENNSMVKDDIFYPKVVAGIDSFVATKDYHCIFKYVYEQDLDDKSIQNITNKTDGIICAELHSKTFHDKLLAANLPLVLVNPSVISNKADTVGIDDFAGGYKATEYLLSLGHKEIAFIGGSCESFPGKYRKHGYIEALEKAGLEADLSHIISYDWRLEDGYQATLELLNLKKRPTAIFAASDLLAIGAINAIKDSGLSVPGDISVLGFDDIEMASQIRPNLSTMRVRKKEIGESAAKLIFEKMESYSAYSVNLSIPTLLQERDSVRKI